MKNRIQSLFVQALQQLPVETLEKTDQLPVPKIERTRDPTHGDFACNLAMKLAKPCRMNPRELAAQLIAALPDSPLIDKTEIAGPSNLRNCCYRQASAALFANCWGHGQPNWKICRNGARFAGRWMSTRWICSDLTQTSFCLFFPARR